MLSNKFTAVLFALIVGALLALPVQEAEAQVTLERPGDVVSISGQAGGFFPTNGLAGGQFQENGALGGSVGLWHSGLVDQPGFSAADLFGVRGNFLWTRTSFVGELPPELVGANPDRFHIGGDVLVRLPIGIGDHLLQPYALSGLGTMVFDFADRSEAELAGSFGGGLEFRFGPRQTIGIMSEVRTIVSDFDQVGIDNEQWDVAWVGGITVNF